MKKPYPVMMSLFSLLCLSHCAQFKLAYTDNKELNLKEYKPIEKTSKMQCAAFCLANNDCTGFSIENIDTCRLLKGEITEGACPGSRCTEIEGYSVYKIITKP